MKHVPNTKYNNIDPDLEKLLSIYRENRSFNAKKYISDKATLLNEYMQYSKLSSCVVAVSGGIDSAIVLGIAKIAMNCRNSPIKKILPVTLPCFDTAATNQKESVDKTQALCDYLKLELIVINITPALDINSNIVEKAINQKGNQWAKGQLVAYSRTPILYYITSLMNETGTPSIILGTNNKDEGAYLGYFGKASDGMVDVQLISDIHKSEVYAIAKEMELPSSIVNAIPAGDMYDGRDDIDVFGAPYDFVELYLAFLEGKINTEILSEKSMKNFNTLSSNLEDLHSYNSHKYIACSPSVHLDLMEYQYEIDGGWKYNNWKR